MTATSSARATWRGFRALRALAQDGARSFHAVASPGATTVTGRRKSSSGAALEEIEGHCGLSLARFLLRIKHELSMTMLWDRSIPRPRRTPSERSFAASGRPRAG
ncbi:MAG: hypothetical protein DMD99_18355 [Candidatus Rokuibacteriota bacterium]|nr:MAG: hypothetical protein DMD99_18355 [Candidatus Rokubacteria bacterium]